MAMLNKQMVNIMYIHNVYTICVYDDLQTRFQAPHHDLLAFGAALIRWEIFWERKYGRSINIGYIYRYGSIPINTIFSGMNIHLPAILMFTRGTRFWHTAIYIYIWRNTWKMHLKEFSNCVRWWLWLCEASALSEPLPEPSHRGWHMGPGDFLYMHIIIYVQIVH